MTPSGKKEVSAKPTEVPRRLRLGLLSLEGSDLRAEEFEGFETVRIDSWPVALDMAQERSIELLIVGIGPEITPLLELDLPDNHLPVITILSDYDAERISKLLEKGIADILLRPLSRSALELAVLKVKGRISDRAESESLRAEVSRRYSFANIVAGSVGMEKIFAIIRKVSEYSTSVLIEGESGTGKELIAKAIHFNSPRSRKRFVAINCGAIPENLLESELFGHKRGAFTDATRDKPGLFEEADGGTIFLDEIGELAPHLQVKLLRVLQEREVWPVGAAKPVPVNIRVVAATLRDLDQDIAEGRFRDDLYYRLNVVTLRIPPLRERKEDIPILVNHFIKAHQLKLGIGVYGVTPEVLKLLIDYSWPGNVRELENFLERAMILAEGDRITLEYLPPFLSQGTALPNSSVQNHDSLSLSQHSVDLERALITEALRRTGGNRTHAAKLLEVSHRTLLYKLKSYMIS